MQSQSWAPGSYGLAFMFYSPLSMGLSLSEQVGLKPVGDGVRQPPSLASVTPTHKCREVKEGLIELPSPFPSFPITDSSLQRAVVL